MEQEQRTGSTAELAVSSKLISIGYDLSFPYGSLPYDIVADKGGRLIRIQVKSATLSKHGSYRCTLARGKGCAKRYSKNECDVIIMFAPYSQDYDGVYSDGFYVVPVEDAGGTGGATLFPSGKGTGNIRICKWEKYRDGWKNI